MPTHMLQLVTQPSLQDLRVTEAGLRIELSAQATPRQESQEKLSSGTTKVRIDGNRPMV